MVVFLRAAASRWAVKERLQVSDGYVQGSAARHHAQRT